jgi:arsenate reductase
MSEITIYHNPRCSKSRATLALIHASGTDPVVVDYLQTPPTASELKAILARLGMTAEALVRKSEAICQSKYAQRVLSDQQWIEAMVADPVLIERPIVVRGDQAILGRPPENVLRLLQDEI